MNERGVSQRDVHSHLVAHAKGSFCARGLRDDILHTSSSPEFVFPYIHIVLEPGYQITARCQCAAHQHSVFEVVVSAPLVSFAVL